MGRHKKQMTVEKRVVSVEISQTTTQTVTAGNLERPKTVTVQAVLCPHCGAKESESERYAHDNRFVEEYGFRRDYMRCKSLKCLETTGGIGRLWHKKTFNV